MWSENGSQLLSVEFGFREVCVRFFQIWSTKLTWAIIESMVNSNDLIISQQAHWETFSNLKQEWELWSEIEWQGRFFLSVSI